jgi:hypothetical protein
MAACPEFRGRGSGGFVAAIPEFPVTASNALLTGERNGYLLRFGTVEKLATALKNAYD